MLPSATAPEKEAQFTDLATLRDALENDFSTELRHTTLDRLDIRADGSLAADGRQAPYQQALLESLARDIGMGLPYAYNIPFELFKYNINALKQQCTREVVLCLHRGVVINSAKVGYRPARTLDLLDAIEREKFWTFQRAQISDQGIEVNYIHPESNVGPEPGDTIQRGVRISNSETGFRGLKASKFALRLACSNGAVISDRLGVARWNFDKRITYDSSVAKFVKDLGKLQGREDNLREIYQNSAQQTLLDTEFCRLYRRLRMSLPTDTVDAILEVDPEERRRLHTAVRERPERATPAQTLWRVYEVHNRITAAPQRLGFSQQNRLERIGGDLLTRTSGN